MRMAGSPSFFLAAILAALVALPTRAESPPCPAQSSNSALQAALPHVAAKLRGGGEVVIVAVGSSSTQGIGATAAENTYPSQLAAELHDRMPGLALRVVNKGVGGENDRAMVARFERDVLAFRPDLVIWQLGTNNVIQDNGVVQDAPTIRRGIEQLKAADADVILMDPQYAPKVLGDPDHSDMLRILDDIARQERVPVFHRFAVMREWIRSGGADFEAILSNDGLHMNDRGYRCIGRLLADSIVDAAQGQSTAIAISRPAHGELARSSAAMLMAVSPGAW